MKMDFNKVLCLAALVFGLAACSNQGFESSTAGSNNNSPDQNNNNSGQGGGSNNGGNNGGGPQSEAFKKLEMDAYVSGGSYDNQQVLGLDKPNNALLLYLPLPVPLSQIYIDVPEVKGISVRTVFDSQQNSRLVVSIPLRYIVRDKVSILPKASTLPDGRALPQMPSGEYPSLALNINPNSSPNKQTYLYLSTEAIGLFFQSSFFPKFGIGITAPIKNKLGTRTLGYFTIVPKTDVGNGGLFLSFLMPDDLGTIIDDHLSGIIN